MSGRQTLLVALFGAAMMIFLPSIWSKRENFHWNSDYRIPYELSSDYWHYARVAKQAAEASDLIALGDSVIWGEYVRPAETLPHDLGAITGKRVANLGLNGLRPTMMIGLLEGYATWRGKKVLLHCNPLWLQSPKTDLSLELAKDDSDVAFNHPALLPQFSPRIPSYRAETSRRLGNVVERYVPFNVWTDHLQAAYFDSKSIPEWMIEHPHENPLKRVTFALAAPADEPHTKTVKNWKEAGGMRQTMEWVDLEKSVQWASFRRAVEILRERGNQVFVLVGPFNEHLLTDAGRERYRTIKGGIDAWLTAQGVPHLAPGPLPSEIYPDASHPFAAGYEMLARQLAAQPFFRE